MKYAIVTVSEKSLTAKLIQFLTLSKWNHVAFYINDYGYNDIIVEINFKGIDFYSFEEYCKNRDVVLHKKTPKINLRKALHFIIKNRDKKYDFLKTLFFFYKSKNIDDKKKWNCVEFIEEIFKDQNINLFEGKKLTPGQINQQLSSEEDLFF